MHRIHTPAPDTAYVLEVTTTTSGYRQLHGTTHLPAGVTTDDQALKWVDAQRTHLTRVTPDGVEHRLALVNRTVGVPDRIVLPLAVVTGHTSTIAA